jgi:hypothetical protein
MKFKKYIDEAKKKQKEGKRDALDQKKALRIPTAKGNQFFKDKSKYSRKKKHKKIYDEKDM